MRASSLLAAFIITLSYAAAQPAKAPARGGAITIRSLSDPDGLNYLTSTDAGAQEIHNLMYESLTTTDWVTLETIPVLARSLPRMSRDRLSYEVSIRRDARFADGTPVTAADFIFFLKALKNPYIINAAPTRGYYARVDRAEMIDGDPYRLRVVMSEPYFLGDQYVGGLIALPKHIWDPKGLTDRISFAELNDNDPNGNPAMREFADWFQDPQKGRDMRFLIGSGPYVCAEYRRNDRVVLVRNENYWNRKDPKYGRAYPDRIVWRTISDANAALASLKAGEIDFMPNVEKLHYIGLRDRLDQFDLDSAVYRYPAYTYIGYNQERPIFADRLVRQALAHAVDREAIIRTVYFDYAVPVQSPILRGRPECDTTLPIIPFNLSKARTLLAQAGWSDSDGDGVLDKVIDGQRTPFRYEILLNAGNERRRNIALIVVQDLRKIGIDASVRAMDWALFLDRTLDGEYDAFIGGWAMGVTEGDMYQIWHSESAERGGSNYVRFRNARVDELIERNRGEFDFRKRTAHYREIQRIIHDEQPYTFLVTELFTGAVSRNVRIDGFYAPRPGYYPAWWSRRDVSGD